MNYKFFELQNVEGVGVVTINKPPANTMNSSFTDELKHLVSRMDNAPDIRCVLFKSAIKKFFSAGADLTDIPSDIPPEAAASMDQAQLVKQMIKGLATKVGDIFAEVHQTFNMVETMRKPTIAAINGHALGGGLEFAMSCDFRFMGRNSGTIGLPEIRLGLLPVAGGTQRLPRLIGRSKALEFMLEGSRISADEALSLGLVNRVFEAEELEKESLSYAKKLARGATYSMGLIKKCVNTGRDRGIPEGLKEERAAAVELVQTEDFFEGLMCFLEKRQPEFKGK
ncbi:MAG: enoyl-CoA hydratase/isomerase family protein [Deltaproteobacteria bacterium]|nr:enoyl-CoA hydratase/isomerase family protein [Deltaproteobacteria bacterium]